MKILLPTIRDPGQIGGTTTHLDMLSRGLEEIGQEAKVLYLGDRVPAAARDLGIVWPAGALNRARRGWGMVYAAALRGRLLATMTARELGRGRWDVLNAQEVYSVPALREVADEHGIPLVLTLHGYPLFESLSEGYTASSGYGRSWLMQSELRALRLADAVVTVDTRLYQHALGLAPERTSSTHALQNFIDTSAFSPGDGGGQELRSKWGVPSGRTVLLCPRRLVKKNGVTTPALALATMPPETRRRFLLLHAGDGGERSAIEAIVREQGLADEVRLLGGQDRDAILELYRMADIVLVPSVHSENVEEATSLAALEAMASGRPLIAGAVGGLAEIVDDGENGLLFPGGDAQALAVAIVRLADDPALGARLAARARDYVVERHSHTTAAQAYVDVYEEARRRVRGRRLEGASPAAGAGMAPGGPSPEDSGPGASPAARSVGVSVLGFPLDTVGVEEATARVLAQAGESSASSAERAPGRTYIAVSYNPELVMRARGDGRVAAALLEADLCFPDGVGAVWAAGWQGVPGLERVPGIELAERVVAGAAARSLPVYFLGAAPGVAELAASALAQRYPGLVIAGTGDGYFPPADEAEAVRRVRESGAAVLLVALGAPRQELFLHDHRDELGAAVGLGVGGTFDVWAGRVKRAPGWAQRWRIEWLYRLAADPRRIRRQTALPRFAVAVLRQEPEAYGTSNLAGDAPEEGRQGGDAWDDLTDGRD